MSSGKEFLNSNDSFKINSGKIEGYLALYGKVDDRPDYITDTAFNSLEEGTRPMLWQHNAEEVIGVWHSFDKDRKGIFVKGELADTEKGNEVKKLAKMKAITGLSMGFTPIDFEYEDNGNRLLKRVDINEGSIVTFPAIKNARISNVYSASAVMEVLQELAEGIDDIQSFEKFLRVAGFSQRRAKVLASSGFKATDSVREVLQSVDNSVSILNSRIDDLLITLQGTKDGNNRIEFKNR